MGHLSIFVSNKNRSIFFKIVMVKFNLEKSKHEWWHEDCKGQRIEREKIFIQKEALR